MKPTANSIALESRIEPPIIVQIQSKYSRRRDEQDGRGQREVLIRDPPRRRTCGAPRPTGERCETRSDSHEGVVGRKKRRRENTATNSATAADERGRSRRRPGGRKPETDVGRGTAGRTVVDDAEVTIEEEQRQRDGSAPGTTRSPVGTSRPSTRETRGAQQSSPAREKRMNSVSTETASSITQRSRATPPRPEVPFTEPGERVRVGERRERGQPSFAAPWSVEEAEKIVSPPSGSAVAIRARRGQAMGGADMSAEVDAERQGETAPSRGRTSPTRAREESL